MESSLHAASPFLLANNACTSSCNAVCPRSVSVAIENESRSLLLGLRERAAPRWSLWNTLAPVRYGEGGEEGGSAPGNDTLDEAACTSPGCPDKGVEEWVDCVLLEEEELVRDLFVVSDSADL
jgi:hypothetical protein